MNRTAHPEQELVMAYLDGELAGEDAARVAAHLDTCDDCGALAAALRRVSMSLREWQVEPAPDSLDRAVANAAAKTAPRARKLRWWSRRLAVPGWAFGLATVMVLFAVLTIFSEDIEDLLDGLGGAMVSYKAVPAPPPPAAEILALSDLPDGAMVARTAEMEIIAREFDGAREAVERIAAARGGFVAELSMQAPEEGPRRLRVTLRVPSAELAAALEELRALGRVRREQQTGEDVSEQHVDLVARLASARTTEARLKEIIRTRTGRVSDVLEAERELARVREQIERMEAQRRSLEDRVRLATISLTLAEEYRAALGTGESAAARLRNAAVEGYRRLTGAALAVGLFLLGYGSALVFFATAVGVPVWLLRRRLRRAPGEL